MKTMNVNELRVRTMSNLQYSEFQTGQHKGEMEYDIPLDGFKFHRRMIAATYQDDSGWWRINRIQVTLPATEKFPSSLKGLKLTTLYGFRKHTIDSYPAVVYLDKGVVTPIIVNKNNLLYDEDSWYTKTSDIDYDTENMLWKVPVLWGLNPLANERFKGVDVSSFCTYEKLLKSIETETEKKAIELF